MLFSDLLKYYYPLPMDVIGRSLFRKTPPVQLAMLLEGILPETNDLSFNVDFLEHRHSCVFKLRKGPGFIVNIVVATHHHIAVR